MSRREHPLTLKLEASPAKPATPSQDPLTLKLEASPAKPATPSQDPLTPGGKGRR